MEHDVAYTMVSAAALGFDLARLDGGPNAAEVLLHALAADEGELQRLANAHAGSCRQGCWDVVHAASLTRPRLSSTLDLSAQVLDLTSGGETERGLELMTRLSGAPIGDLDALDRLVRRELLDWTWESINDVSVQRLRDRFAADVLVDAAASAYCSDLLDDGVRRHLATPYLSAVRGYAGAAALPGAEGRVGRVLEEVSTWSARDRDDWRAAVDLLRSGSGAWTAAMHDAGWAAHLSGRVRTAAASQLQGVIAFRHAGFTAQDAAEGSWNALSGTLQALTVADILGDDELAVLLRPWQLARGAQPGRG
ncbi:hypothetical protein GCM10027446_28920 [Angustibacter peucedani]